MGKVYDALRRAEEQRGSRASQPGVPSVQWEPRAAKRRARRGVDWRKWLEWLQPAGQALPEDANATNKRRISLLEPDSFVAEQFRTLRARLDSIAAQRPLRTLIVTSAVGGEGKSTAAINLAIVTSMQSERRPLLVDCDMRKPSVHRVLGVQPEAGLAEVLMEEAPLEKAIYKVEGLALEVLPVRRQPANPSELLASGKMKSLIEELLRRYDPVIFDAPAALGLPDAKILSERVDGVVLVVKADSTSREDVENALDVLDRRRIAGLVLNSAHLDVERYDYRH